MSLIEFARLLSTSQVPVSIAVCGVPGGMEVAIQLGDSSSGRNLSFNFQNGKSNQGQHLDDVLIDALEEFQGEEFQEEAA
jgi:hypothetical protein